tara:strand:+ start:9047 stop:11389 length:2343 start_codon:yes stop_codon:yes gene_type:complete
MATSINQSQLKTSNVVLQDILDITKDIVISADYSCFGSQVDGGAGFCIYLYGGTSLDTSIGSPDAGLGYAPTDGIVEVDGNDVFSGVNNAVFGVGFDVQGNFALPLGGDVTTGAGVARPNSVTLRKGTDDNFQYISTSDNLSSFSFDIYQVYGHTAPIASPTPTQSRTATQTSTKNVATPTLTTTQTQTQTVTPSRTTTQSPTQTRTKSPTPTRTRTVTPTSTYTSTITKSSTPIVSPTVTGSRTRTQTPTSTTTNTRTTTQTPTNTPLKPSRRTVKVRLTDYGNRALVYVRNGISGDYNLVLDQKNLGLSIPNGNHVMVGLSYSTGTELSRFWLRKFEVNGIGFEGKLTPTPTKTSSRTTTQTRTGTQNPTPTSTRTRTPSQTETRTRTPSQSPTQTQTRTQTPTETPLTTRTQTPTQTRTQTPTQSRTPTQTATRTATQTRTRTASRTPTKPVVKTQATDSSFMFRFTSLYYYADNYDKAIQILLNNARFSLNNSINNSSLFSFNGDGEAFAIPPSSGGNIWTGTLCHQVDTGNNNQYAQAWYYDGPAVDGQRGDPGRDGQQGWRTTLLAPPSQPRETNNVNYKGNTPQIPLNVWSALTTLFSKGGTTYGSSPLKLGANDNSSSVSGTGSDHPIWNPGVNDEKDAFTISSQSNQVAKGKLDQQGCSYKWPSGTEEEILYNYDNITSSPITGGTSREDFENLFDINRTVPNVNYLHVQQPGSDLDITFSYATELININEGPAKVPPGAAQPGTDFPGNGNGRDYKGARITLWTNAYQGQ